MKRVTKYWFGVVVLLAWGFFYLVHNYPEPGGVFMVLLICFFLTGLWILRWLIRFAAHAFRSASRVK